MVKLFKTKRQARRKQPSNGVSAANWVKLFKLVFVLLPMIGAGFYIAQMPQIFPISRIQISGSFEYLNQSQVEKMLREKIGQGFFSVDIKALQKSLGEKPWVDSASIRRVWPDQLKVSILEKRAVARWDKKHLLSDKAQLFKANTKSFQHLPKVHAGHQTALFALTQFRGLGVRFKLVGERVVALEIDSRGALDIELADGLKIKLGRSEIERKVDRLVSIFTKQIKPRREKIRQLDLRYSNGFAVAWKKQILRDSNKLAIWSNSNV